MKRNGKRYDVRIEFTSRHLSAAEAGQMRQAVIELKPRTHFVLANWRWLECRGIAEAKAAQLVETLGALGVRFKVTQ